MRSLHSLVLVFGAIGVGAGCGSGDENGPSGTGPTASFSSSCINMECSFTNLSRDGAATIAASSWEFGDGAVATTQDAQHTYATATTYAVKLTVTDNAGLTGQVTHAVQVNRLSNMPPIGAQLAPSASLGR
jgi:PKD repeat protein